MTCSGTHSAWSSEATLEWDVTYTFRPGGNDMLGLRLVCGSVALAALFLTWQVPANGDVPIGEREALKLSGVQKDYLTHEPILLTARLETADPKWRLPAGPGKNATGTIRFEVTPAVKERPGAKGLPF